jgi:fructosamine-3-kinase
MNDESLKDIDLGYLYEEAGRLTSRIHKIANGRFGWLRPSSDWGLFNSWSDFILSFAGEAADKADAYDVFAAADTVRFRDIFAENRSLLDEITVPHMTHTDLWKGNILLTKDGDDYRIAAIIDLDRTIFGDEYLDISTGWMVNDAFLKGYGRNIEKTASYENRQFLYKLLLAFCEAYIYKVEYEEIDWYNRKRELGVTLLDKYPAL